MTNHWTSHWLSRLSRCMRKLNHHKLWQRPVSLWGIKYIAPTADRLLALCLHRVGLLGKKERELFQRFVKPGMRVADIGANQGLFTFLFSQRVGPTGTVDAFEPVPSLFQALTQNRELNTSQNVHLHSVALSNREGIGQIYLSELNSGDNRLNASVGGSQSFEVKLTRLDHLLPDASFDFIKIDVQGHELDVLLGLENTLKKSPSLRIYFEYWPDGLQKAGSRPQDVLAFFTRNGFSLYQADSDLQPITPSFEAFTQSLRGQAYTNLLASRDPL